MLVGLASIYPHRHPEWCHQGKDLDSPARSSAGAFTERYNARLSIPAHGLGTVPLAFDIVIRTMLAGGDTVVGADGVL